MGGQGGKRRAQLCQLRGAEQRLRSRGGASHGTCVKTAAAVPRFPRERAEPRPGQARPRQAIRAEPSLGQVSRAEPSPAHPS